MAISQRSARYGLFIVYTILLFVSFAYDAFRLSGNVRSAHIGSDSFLVLNRLQLAIEGAERWQPMAGNTLAGGHYPYYSQVGLQGIVLSEVRAARGMEPLRFAHLCATACALMTAGVLSIFFVSSARIFGLFAANVGVFLAALSPTFLDFAPSLYWCSFLLFAPFVCVWSLYPICQSKKARLCLWLAVFALVLVKSLCGYEYITSLVLSVVVPVAFHRYRAGELRRQRLPELLGWIAAGGAGFVTAIGLHVVQLHHLLGAAGWQKIVDRARARIYAGDPRVEVPLDFGNRLSILPDSIEYPVNCFLKYFGAPAVILPGGYEIDVWALALAAVGLVVYTFKYRREASLQIRSLALALALSLVTSLSWQVAAINHMCVHFHLNQIVFWMPFLLIAVLAVGYLLQQLAMGLQWDQRLLPLMGPACLLLVLVSSLRYVDNQVVQQAVGSMAERNVLAALAQPVAGGNAAGLLGHIDQVTPGASRWCGEMARSLLVPATQRSREVVVQGWAVDTQAPGEKRSIVVMQGQQVLPTRNLVFFDRPDISEHLKLNTPKAGFVVSVSCVQPEDNPPLRVFVVAGKQVSRVAEISRH